MESHLLTQLVTPGLDSGVQKPVNFNEKLDSRIKSTAVRFILTGRRQPCLDGPSSNIVTPASEPGSIAGDGVFRVPTMDPGSRPG